MKLLIIRHGDPDYENDGLTEKGRREAEYLAEYLADVKIDACYVSPLGRARATAAPVLARKGMEAEVCQWLREFHAPIKRPDAGGKEVLTWDWLPEDWTGDERYFSPDRWYEPEIMADGHVKEAYDWVAGELDALLARHGYQRDGRMYRAVRPNSDTVALFCHFGVECVLLSHLMSASPMVLWHGLCAAPTSVTTVYTEERREGAVFFRASGFGDISHLALHGEAPSFSARFRELYTNDWARRD